MRLHSRLDGTLSCGYGLSRTIAWCKVNDVRPRPIHNDSYQRLSGMWVPTGGIARSNRERTDDSQSILIRAGYIRQAYSGVFHFLPLGLRIQEKLEKLIDKHMRLIGASKLALSTISSESRWRESGRLENPNADLFRVLNRQKSGFLLSPTHEEEITALVAPYVRSYKDLPLRLYQISVSPVFYKLVASTAYLCEARKYRDELRPRHGLLRAREFIMKDLYTFDISPELAMGTYQRVRRAYSSLFDELKMQYLVAEASSGDMGGSLSHEYHLPNSAGEDEIVSCDNCSYQANMEIASDEATTVGIVRSRSAAPDTGGTSGDRVLEPVVAQEAGPGPPSHILMWSGVADNGPTLVNVFYPRCSSQAGREKGINVAAIKSIVPSLDAGREDAAHWWEAQYLRHSENEPSIYKPRIINIYDGRLSTAVDSSGVSAAAESLISEQIPSERLAHVHTTQMTTDPASGRLLNVLSVVGGDPCPRCREGRLRIQQAIELGHTFFLGTRYTEIFRAHAHVDGAADPKESTTRLPLQMGCYGIGVSRVIGAVAGAIADEKGLNWPRVMAPFEVVVIYRDPMEEDAKAVYDALRDGVPTDDSARSNDGLSSHSATLDIVLDDRRQGFIWKLKDADLLGFPVVVVLGRAWASERKLEVHCRRLGGLREEVPLRELPAFVHGLLDQL